ncbi:MAG: N5-glutamine methyltransferase family protein, partial [Acidimicrobiales bacterium]
FCGVPVHVERGVFVPRPQSEELARRAARAVPVHGRVADLCSGAGAIAAAVTHLAPSASVAATDVDERAARCARRNGVDVLLTDIDGGLASRTFDVVTAVAPYVPSDAIRYLPADVQRFEPRAALDGGTDGLDIVRRVIAAAARLLIPGGSLFIELGADQATALGPVLAVYGFATPERWYDEDGDVRGMAALLIP